jgi:hypothetical protein
VKLLEFIVEMVALHWQDIVDLLIEEVMDEEVQEMNRVENLKTVDSRR